MRLWPIRSQPKPVDTEALVARAAAGAVAEYKAAQEAANAAAREQMGQLEEILRAQNGGIMGLPSIPTLGATGTPYKAYARDYPWNYTIPQAPSFKPGALLDTFTLRRLADQFDILRSVMLHLQRELCNVPIRIVAADDADKTERTKARIKEATAWFDVPGGLGGPGKRREHFEYMMVEDVLTIGAAAMLVTPTRGGGVYSIECIDAATIRARVDAYGWPGPGEDWYEQWVMGVKVRGFTREELVYDGLHARTWTPYFASATEYLALTLFTSIKLDEWNRVWLTDGNEPGTSYSLPDNWTPNQVRDFMDRFIQYAGDSVKRQQLRIWPGGTKLVNQSRRDQEFSEFSMYLVRRVCSLFGVQPASIGYADQQYKSSQQDAMAATSEFGVTALLAFRAATYTDFLRRLGYPDLLCVNVVAQEEEASDRATRNAALVSGAIKTPNEARIEEGLDPMEGGDTLFVSTNLTPLELSLNPPMPETGPAGAESGGDQAAQSEAQQRLDALRLWEKKALRRLKERGSAVVTFDHEALPHRLLNPIIMQENLGECETPEQVRAVFADLRKSVEVPPAHAPSIQQHERQQIAARWRERRLAAEREAG
jgi:Phage portal protein